MLTGVRRVQRALCLLLLALLILTPALQIVMRGVFNVPMAGAEELTRYFLIALTLLGGGYVTLQGGQIRMEEIQALLPARLRFFVQVLIDLCGVAMFAIIFLASVRSIANNLNNHTATLEMPFWLFMGPLTVGMLLLVAETLAELWRTWRAGQAGDKHTTLS